MRCVIGLGNPGQQYDGTRHNVGFAVVDLLAARLSARLKRHACGAELATRPVDDLAVGLIKPMTFMNRSGQPMAQLLSELAVALEDALVVVDDFHLDLGRLRLRVAGGHGGHNGLRSIIERLGDAFPRLRLGIGPAAEGADIEDFVLAPFRPGDRKTVDAMIWKAADAAEEWLRGSEFETLMNRYNGKQT